MVASSLLLALVPLAAAGPLGACKAPTQPQQACTAPRGNITIRQPGLYPENADFDPKRCVTYIGYVEYKIRRA
jgi:hypothetical protein